MGLFNFLNKQKGSGKAIVAMLPVSEAKNTTETQGEASEPSCEEKQKPLTVSYATGWPIDVIYGYLHKNYEQKGFDDAIVKNDLAFRDMNINIIRNKILMVFREINLNYDVMKHDLQTRMDTCSAAGLLTTVSDIERSMTIIATHKSELCHLEDDFRNGRNEASIPLQSYECGFLRGIATVAMSGLGNKSIPMPMSAPSNNMVVSA
jgi:hypothetical protein